MKVTRKNQIRCPECFLNKIPTRYSKLYNHGFLWLHSVLQKLMMKTGLAYTCHVSSGSFPRNTIIDLKLQLILRHYIERGKQGHMDIFVFDYGLLEIICICPLYSTMCV